MRKLTYLILLVLLTQACKSTRIGETRELKLTFLDDHVIPDSSQVEGTEVGGLSGIDYHEGRYYIVSDDPRQPRIYIASIKMEQDSITSVDFEDVLFVKEQDSVLRKAHLDMESLLFDPENRNFTLSSEGNIDNGKDPLLFSISETGDFIRSYDLPPGLLAGSQEKPRNNGSLEGLARSEDGKAVWAAMELPLATDGPKPKLIRTKSPVRITRFDKNSGKPTAQFPYRLEPIAKIPWLYFAVNGVTDLLQYAPNKFLVLERGFAAGHGSKGNTVRIYDVDTRLATNVLERDNLNVSFYNPAKKTLLYDFKWAKKFLDTGFIDNIEGMTFGPKLPNGNSSIILVSDNNFNSLGQQVNQVILLEFEQKIQ